MLPHFFDPFRTNPAPEGARVVRIPEGLGPWSSLTQKAVTAASGVSGNSRRMAA
jgi:hypothetical protein